MSRITKEIAKQVAVKLTETKRLEIEKLNKTFKENAFKAYEKKIPKEVLICFAKHPNYFDTTTQIKMIGNGWNHEYIDITSKLPSNDSSWPKPQFDEKTAQSLLKEYDKINKLKKEFSALKAEIENALIRLGTYKRVGEQFNEAYEHLPANISQALIVNVDKIREKL